jgi:transposase-like protein
MDPKMEEKVIELRLQGESYEEIAHQLKLNQSELLEWTKARQERAKPKGCGCC